jgi:hypothetical protein
MDLKDKVFDIWFRDWIYYIVGNSRKNDDNSETLRERLNFYFRRMAEGANVPNVALGFEDTHEWCAYKNPGWKPSADGKKEK